MREGQRKLMDTAFAWRAVMADERVSVVDRRLFEDWLRADPLHRAAYERAEEFWEELGALRLEDLDAAFGPPSWTERIRVGLHIAARAFEACMRPRTGLIAGGLTVACVFAFFAFPRPPYAPKESYYATAVGETRPVRFEDGSHMTLGAESTVSVTFATDIRRARLDVGEAFFEIAADADRPFEVSAGNTLVTVHGTAFNVRRVGPGACVAVTEGVVSVSAAEDGKSTLSAEMDGRQSAMLSAGEQVVVLADGRVGEVIDVRPETIGCWRDDLLVYIDAPLSEIIADINRYRTRKISIADKDVAALKVTVTFSGRDTDGMLESLAEVFPVKVESTSVGQILSRAR